MGINTRTKILGAIAGISLIFGVYGMVGTFQTQPATLDLSTYNAPMLLGHATIQMNWEDGKTIYQQTDNQMNIACLSAIHGEWSGNIVGATGGPFTTLDFYSDTVLMSSAAANPPNNHFNTRQTAVLANYGTTTNISGAGINPDLGFIISFGTKTFLATDSGEFARQIALTDGVTANAEQVCAAFAIDACAGTVCGISPATTHTITWTLNTLT